MTQQFKKGDRVRITQATSPGGTATEMNAQWRGRTATVLGPGRRGDATRVLLDEFPPNGAGDRERDWHTAWLEMAQPVGILEGSVLDKAFQAFARARQLNGDAVAMADAADRLIDALLAAAGLPDIDTSSSASRQSFVETGRFMYEGEEA